MIVGGVHLKSTQISPDWTEETRDFLRIDFREQDLDLHVFVVLLCSMLFVKVSPQVLLVFQSDQILLILNIPVASSMANSPSPVPS